MATATIHIKFVEFQLRRWLGATRAIKKEALHQKNDLPFRQAVGYVFELRKNISSGKYSGLYQPYSERYLAWKRDVFKSSRSFWMLKGYLLSSLSAFRSGKGWMGGIPSGLFVEGSSWFGSGYTGQSRYIAQYAHWMEYGRSGQPARPLFRPTLVEYSKSGGLKEAIKSLNKIASKWD